jgi:competence protein ComEC
VWCFGLVCLGFVCGREVDGVDPLAFVAAALAMLVVALLTTGWTCRGALALAAVAFSTGWIGVRMRTADPLTLWAQSVNPHAEVIVTVEGLAVESPRTTNVARGEIVIETPSAHRRSSVFALDVRRLVTDAGVRPARGRVLVRVDGPPPAALRAGETLRVSGTFAPIEGPLNAGEPDRRIWANERGGVGRLDVSSPALIEPAPLELPTGDRLRCAWLKAVGGARSRVAAALDAVGGPVDTRDGPDRARALLAILLLGQREQGIEGVEGPFARQGLVHVLAISGFHLAVLAWGVLRLVRLLGEHERLEGFAVAGAVLGYLALVPAEAPVLRCGVTVLVFLVVEASGRRYDRLNTLAWVAIALVMWHPSDLWSPGFQLSFGVVAALITCADATTRRFFGTALVAGSGVRAGAGIHPRAPTPLRRLADGVLDHVKGLVASSVLCWAVASPLVAYHAGWFSPLAALTSVVVIPLSAVLLCIGYVSLAVGAASATLGAWLGAPARALSERLADAITWLDQSTWSAVALPLVSPWWTGFAAIAVLMVFSWRGRRWLAWAALGLAVAWFAGEVTMRGRLGGGVLLRIDTLAVGDGTCHLVRSRRPGSAWWEPDEALIWDAGSLRADIGLRDLPRAIRCAGGGGAWEVPTICVTHPNTDHYVAIPELVRPLGVRRVLLTGAFTDAAAEHPRAPAGQLVDILDRRGVEVGTLARGDGFGLGAARVRVLWPPDGRRFLADNDGSLVARFEVATRAGPRVLMLDGDVSREAIGALLADSPPAGLHADILEAPHHGSYNDRVGEFITAVGPAVMLQSTGPRRALDNRLDPFKAGRAWYVTPIDGAAWAEILADGTVRSGSLRRSGVNPPSPNASSP